MGKIAGYIFMAVAAFLALSCEPVEEHMPEFEVKGKTVLVYMVGNNNLSYDASRNLEGIKKGYVPDNDNLLVYYHTPEQSPLLLKIWKDESGAVQQDTAYRFPSRNSSTAESLKSAMQVTGTMFPADEYGLFLWSHGTGWLPQGHYNSKSFGYEEGEEIDIKQLVKAFPYRLSFVVFDACLMGGIEVVYQMKDSVDYVISSPAEILVDGFPYQNIMKHVYRNPTDLESVAREYFDFYNSRQGQMRSATISLVETAALDGLAQAAGEVFDKYREKLATFNRAGVQRYYRGDKAWFYDFGDFIMQLAGESDAAPVLDALDRAVIYKGTTPYFLEIPIDNQRFSGLSTYIPALPEEQEKELESYYRGLEWNKAVGMIE